MATSNATSARVGRLAGRILRTGRFTTAEVLELAACALAQARDAGPATPKAKATKTRKRRA